MKIMRAVGFFQWRQIVVVIVAALVVVWQPGCVAVVAGVAGAGAVAYVRGELQALLDAPYASVVRAANRAVSELEFVKVSERMDALTAVLIARTANDKKVEIRILKSTDAITRVEIRVGIFGEEALSQTVLAQLREHL